MSCGAGMDKTSRQVELHDMMPHRVREVLLVSSLYDSFILEEDGRITDVVLNDYLNLNLRFAPRFERADTAEQALRLLRHRNFDLMITMLRVGRMNVREFALKAREIRPQLPISLLTYNTPELDRLMNQLQPLPDSDLFVWHGDAGLFLAMIKLVEDRRNVEHDVRIGNVRLIIIVEDSSRFYSSFLPFVYMEVMKQVRKLISEGLNDVDRALRMRARPKILLAHTFEEAWVLLERYHHNVLGVISDIRFPRDGVLDGEAGFRLLEQIKKLGYDIPVVLQSAEEENAARAREQGAEFINKNSPDLLQNLREFMLTHMGFGDFVFRTPDGREVARVSNIRGLEKLLYFLPPESLIYHATRNHFSNWLQARGEFFLADALRPRKVSEFENAEELRQYLIQMVSLQRERNQSGIIADFSRQDFHGDLKFARIGSGSIGGKARGIAFINALLARSDLCEKFPGVNIQIPRTVVVGTDIFDEFVDSNGLHGITRQRLSDGEIVRRFRQGRFPPGFLKDLKALLEQVHFPLAVRSSSLLEDSQFQPFAGLYSTYMLANNDNSGDARLRQLLQAIKYIFASAFFRDAILYAEATGNRPEEEKMAVIIQQLAGRRYGHYFYPTFSGVAQSYNFYPVGYMKPEEGIAMAALGLGRTVVEGGNTVRFSPRFPRVNPQFTSLKEMLNSSQHDFYALDLHRGSGTLEAQETGTLVRLPLTVAEEHGTLNFVGSTFSAPDNRLYDGLHHQGLRVVTFANILKHGVFPLAEILSELLRMAEKGMGTAAEIEFAVNLDPRRETRDEFHFLQVRPLVLTDSLVDINMEQMTTDDALCYSEHVLGNGIYRVELVLWVDPEDFAPERSRQVAELVGQENARLAREGERCLLLGPGRWGSSDPWLGIPVTWPQISQALAVIEVGDSRFNAEPSQGSHFFQNLTSMRIGYFTVHPKYPRDWINWELLRRQPLVRKWDCLRLSRPPKPLVVSMDGRSGKGVISLENVSEDL